MALAAEEVGFDSIWLGDHLLYRDEGEPERGPSKCWTLLTSIAALTERVGARAARGVPLRSTRPA